MAKRADSEEAAELGQTARGLADPEDTGADLEVGAGDKAWLLAVVAVQVAYVLVLASLAVLMCVEMARVLVGTARGTPSL